jgi:hypothetical protein
MSTVLQHATGDSCAITAEYLPVLLSGPGSGSAETAHDSQKIRSGYSDFKSDLKKLKGSES